MTLRTATRDQGAGITAPRSRPWAIGSGADASGALPGETDEGTRKRGPQRASGNASNATLSGFISLTSHYS